MPVFTKGKWKYLPALYQVISYPEGDEFDIVDGAHVFWDNNAPALWHYITGEINGLNNSEEEAHANGRLIAEAPTMYGILRNIQCFCVNNDLDPDIEQDIHEVLQRIDGEEVED